MRGLRAGLLAAVCAAAGCKDNPGFILLPDGPSPAETTSVGPGTGEPPADSSSSVAPETTESPTSTTGDPETSTTDPPPAKCGDEHVDVERGEQCDDGNDIPHDDCTNDCRHLFVKLDPLQVAGTCIGLLAAPIDPGNEDPDLLLVDNLNPVVHVLENDGAGNMFDAGHGFTTGQGPAIAAITHDLDLENGKDVLSINNIVSVCINDPDLLYCTDQVDYAAPDLMGFFDDFLQVDNMDNDLKGAPDVVGIGNFGESLAIMKGLGMGLFDMTMIKSLDFPDDIANGAPTALAVGAFTGSVEYPDVAVGYKTGTGKVMLFADVGLSNLEQKLGPFMIGSSVTSIAITDFGVGGDLGDIVVTDPVGGRLVYLSDIGNAGLEPQDEFITIGPLEQKVVVGPLRGDAPRDIVTVDVGGSFIHVAAVLDGKLPEDAYDFDTELAGLVDVVLADLDGDGDGDIAVVNTECKVRVLLNQTVVKP